MEIGFKRVGEDIVTIRNYTDIKDKGEIAHIICELEITKYDLIALWDEWDKKDKNKLCKKCEEIFRLNGTEWDLCEQCKPNRNWFKEKTKPKSKVRKR